MKGKNVNGYTIQQLLGMGGMAEVWLAENSIGKTAAVKMLLPKFCNDENIVARFQNEARVMQQLNHPNIRQVYDYCNIDERPCIIMEYLEGSDLKALMRSGKHFTEEELRKWWNQIADALNFTHSKGIVHRDIKPSNIFVDNNGNIKLLDFGIAKIKESISMTQTGALMGTLLYMSPEQVQDSKHIGPQSDIYSLAVTFVHLLTGEAPYDSTGSDYAIRKGIVEVPLDMTGVPATWQNFLRPYLAKNPADRPKLRAFDPQAAPLTEATIIACANDEETQLSNRTMYTPTAPRRPNTNTHPKRSEKKGRIGCVLVVILLIIVGAGLAIYFIQENSSHSSYTPAPAQNPVNEEPTQTESFEVQDSRKYEEPEEYYGEPSSWDEEEPYWGDESNEDYEDYEDYDYYQ